jgi:hypothetical protein
MMWVMWVLMMMSMEQMRLQPSAQVQVLMAQAHQFVPLELRLGHL